MWEFSLGVPESIDDSVFSLPSNREAAGAVCYLSCCRPISSRHPVGLQFVKRSTHDKVFFVNVDRKPSTCCYGHHADRGQHRTMVISIPYRSGFSIFSLVWTSHNVFPQVRACRWKWGARGFTAGHHDAACTLRSPRICGPCCRTLGNWTHSARGDNAGTAAGSSRAVATNCIEKMGRQTPAAVIWCCIQRL